MSLTIKFQPALLKYAREGERERDGAASSRDPRRNNPRYNLDSWSEVKQQTRAVAERRWCVLI